jgi:hypothetical protein
MRSRKRPDKRSASAVLRGESTPSMPKLKTPVELLSCWVVELFS